MHFVQFFWYLMVFCSRFIFECFVPNIRLLLHSIVTSSNIQLLQTRFHCVDIFFIKFRFYEAFTVVKRNSHTKVFLGKGVLKICSKFTGGHPCWNLISIKFVLLQICCIFSEHFSLRTPLGGCFWINNPWLEFYCLKYSLNLELLSVDLPYVYTIFYVSVNSNVFYILPSFVCVSHFIDIYTVAIKSIK